MNLPHFVIIGAMKCGTTTLQHQLTLQNGVFMTEPKEPNFFSDDPIYAKGLTWYSSLYEGAPKGALLGEASTHYTKLPTYPETVERMAKAVPEAKLVYMVRDPIARAISHLKHAWTMREIGGDLDAEARRLKAVTAYSSYNQQLAAWRKAYSDQDILVVALERLQKNPDEEFDRVLRFLGLNGAWRHDAEAQNQGSERLREFPLHGLLIDNPIARLARQALIPEAFRKKIAAARQTQGLGVSEETRAYLAETLSDDLRQFGSTVGISDLKPATFKEQVLSQQLVLGGGTSGS